MSRARILTGEQLVNCESWQAPVVEGHLAGFDGLENRVPTARDLQGLQKQAYDEAYTEGLEQGKQQGYIQGKSTAEQEFNRRLQLLSHCLARMTQPFEDLDDEVEQNLVQLSVAIARQIVKREFQQDPGEIVGVVRDAIKVLPLSSRHVSIYLHPEDAELIRNALSLQDEDRRWSVEEDIALTRGDCHIESESSVIDATIETRLAAAAAGILGGTRDGDTRKPG